MDPHSKDLVSVSDSSPVSVRGLDQPGRWSLYGAGLGVASTAAVTLLPALLSGSAPVAAVCLSGLASATVVGAYLGRRWHRLVSKERGTMSVGQWVLRFGGHGALWGAAAAWGTILPLAFAGAPLYAVASALAVGTVVAGTAGAAVTALLGVSHVVDLTRGDAPWKSLALAFVLGPSALMSVIVLLHLFARIIGIV